jgi:putative ABC transport system permease protein
MKIGLLAGRDLNANDTYPGSLIVNETLAKLFFDGENPVGKTFERSNGDGKPRMRQQIVGLVRDARYHDMREGNLPVAYVPFHWVDAHNAVMPRGGPMAFLVRTAAANPVTLASVLRKEVSRVRPEFRVSNIRTQKEWIDMWTIRERLLAMLAVFFAGVALLLAAVGLYGVLDYSVTQRQREIGIRMAVGAQAGDIARRVTAETFSMMLAGAVAGLALGIASGRYVETLLYGVRATDVAMLAIPSVTMVVAALAAALPAVIRAARVDPVNALRSE